MSRSAKLLVGILILVALLSGAAAFAYVRYVQPTSILAATQAGHQLEDFIPIDSNFLVAVDFTKQAQYEKLDQIVFKTTGKHVADVLSSLAATQTDALDRSLAAALIKSKKVVIGGYLPVFDSRFLNTPNPDANLAAPTHLYLAFETGEAASLAQQITADKAAGKDPSAEQVSAIAEDDVLIVSTQTEEAVNKLVYARPWQRVAVSQRAEFKKIAGALPDDRLISMYLNQETAPETQEKSEEKSEKKETATFSALMGISLSANDDGITGHVITSVLEPKDAEAKLIAAYKNPPESIVKKVPTAGLLLVSESFNVAAQVEAQPSVFQNLKLLTGFDFSRDLAPVMKGASVFLLSDAGSIIPALSFYSEVTDGPTAAAPFLTKIDELVSNLTVFANYSFPTDPAKGPFIERALVNEKGLSAQKIILHPENVRAQDELPPVLLDLSKSFQITYGTYEHDGKTMVFLSTNPKIVEDLSNPAVAGVGTEPLTAYENSVDLHVGGMYMNTTSFGAFIAHMLSTIDKEQVQTANIIKEKSALFEGLYSASGIDGNSIVQKILLKVVK